MNEAQKTLAFAGVAVAAVLLAWEPWQHLTGAALPPTTGVTRLFPKFDDPKKAKSIQITKFNEDNARLSVFSVKRVKGRWMIPSHQDYPADASEHMAAAAISVLDLESLSMASDRPGDFETFGVIAPDASKLKVGSTGVGMQVVFRGDDDALLADLIIGKKDKDHPDLRFVRVADHDQIYKVKFSVDKLSTKFDDWIEKEFLKLNPLDVRELALNDYSIHRVEQGLTVDRRGEIKLSYDDAKSKWQIENIKEFQRNEPIEAKLGPDEEPDAEKLNALKNALGDLKIIDVQRKPEGLTADLSVGEALQGNRETLESLVKRGFYPLQTEDGHAQMVSSEGEVIVYCKDGIEYMLRFGATAVADAEDDEKAEADKDAAGGEAANGDEADKDETGAKKKKSRLSRYLMVTCKFLEDRIPLPELKELPPAPEGEPKPADEKAAGDKGTDEKAADEKTSGEAPKDSADPAEAPKTDEKTSPAKEDQSAAPRANVFRLTADEKPVEPAATPVDTTEKPAEASPTEPAAKEAPAAPAADAAPAAESAAEKSKTDAPADADADEEQGGKIRAQAREAKALSDQRTLIEKENKRNQAAYDEQIKNGRKRAKDLNERFAPWYYLISDEVYHKIHLGRPEVIKTKPKDAAKEDGPGALDMLKKQGVGGAAHKHDEHDHDHELEKK